MTVTAAAASTRANQPACAVARTRPTSQVPAPEPMATPATTAASVAANAYVVGPSTRARMRVQAISCTSAENPDSPRTAIASQGCGFVVGTNRLFCLASALGFPTAALTAAFA